MAPRTHPGDTDMLLPLPGPDERWDPHLIHTHYFGFSVPEAAIGAFLYVRYQPAFPLCQGGVCMFQGTDNVEYTDMAYLDYEITMPWPTIDGNTITTDNGSVHRVSRTWSHSASALRGRRWTDVVRPACRCGHSTVRARPRHAGRRRPSRRVARTRRQRAVHARHRATAPRRRDSRGRLLRTAGSVLASSPGGETWCGADAPGRVVTDVLRRRPDLQPDQLRTVGHRSRLGGSL